MTELIVITPYRSRKHWRLPGLSGNYRTLRSHDYGRIKALVQAVGHSWRGDIVFGYLRPLKLLNNFGLTVTLGRSDDDH